eukprot:TRINITY_DN4385_c0_g1_i2.p4 TRINITY_DN4385_c0_g1~~TRINITY_DN4385_c0_g1_i2.p4  ORF type:complete len:103 (-),score=14.50 TRINITY_DN4385_c0_g1_i2:13-321(-)
MIKSSSLITLLKVPEGGITAQFCSSRSATAPFDSPLSSEAKKKKKKKKKKNPAGSFPNKKKTNTNKRRAKEGAKPDEDEKGQETATATKRHNGKVDYHKQQN